MSVKNRINANNNDIILKNIDFYLQTGSDIVFSDINNLICKNIKITSIDNSGKFILESIQTVQFNNSYFEINKVIDCKKLYYMDCLINIINKTLKFKCEDVIKFIRNDLYFNNDDIKKLQEQVFNTRILIILDSIIRKKNKEGVFYPRLVLQINYRN